MNGYGNSPLEVLAARAVFEGIAIQQDFTYNADYITGTSTALGASGTVDAQVLINTDADFVVQQRNIIAYDSAGPPTVLIADPNFLIKVTLAGSGSNLKNTQCHVLNYCGQLGSNKNAGYVPTPTLLMKGQIMTVQLQNLTTTVISRAQVSFVGFKIKYIANPTTGRVGSREEVFNMPNYGM